MKPWKLIESHILAKVLAWKVIGERRDCGDGGGIASLRASISYRQMVKSKCLMPRREPSIFFSFLMQVLDMPIYDNVDQSGD